jgi:hypothetical protein
MNDSKQKGRDPKTGRFLPGNQCAERHGYYSLAKGRVPQIPGIRAIRKDLQRIGKELEAMTPNPDVRTKLLVGQVVKTAGMILLLERYMRKAGILAPQKWRKGIVEAQPAMKIYLQILDGQRRALAMLNVDGRQVEKILTPLEIVQEEEKEKSKVERGG